MKNKLTLMVGILAFIYFLCATTLSGYASFIGYAFSWTTVIELFTPLILLVLCFVYVYNKEVIDVLIIKKRLFTLYILVLMLSFWIFAPIENYYLLNISGKELTVQVFSYLWETMLLGGITVMIFTTWFKPIGEFLKNYESHIEKITSEEAQRVSDLITKFPLRTATAAPIFTVLGYTLGSLQFYLINPNISYLTIINNLLIGLAIGPITFLAIYFFSRRILKDTNNILYTFGDITSPKKALSINAKIIFFGAAYGSFFVPIFVGLLINFIMGGIGLMELFYGLSINFIFSLMVVLFVGETFSRNLISSLSEIKKGLEIIRGGNYNYQINIKTGDEVENIAYEFNKTMQYLAKNKKQP